MHYQLMSKVLSWGMVVTSLAYLIYSLFGDVSFATAFTGPDVVWTGLMFITLFLLLLMNVGLMLFMRTKDRAGLYLPLRHFAACLGIAGAIAIAGLWVGEIRIDASRPADAFPKRGG